LTTGQAASAVGLRLGNTLVLHESDDVAPMMGTFHLAAAGGLPTTGEQRTLVLLVNYADDRSEPVTVAQMQTAVFSQTDSFFRENSYGQTFLSGEVHGWFPLAITKGSVDPFTEAELAEQQATAAGINVASFSRIVLYQTSGPNSASGGFAGLGTVGGNPSYSWLTGAPAVALIAHEMGHNFGLMHANRFECGAGVVVSATCGRHRHGVAGGDVDADDGGGQLRRDVHGQRVDVVHGALSRERACSREVGSRRCRPPGVSGPGRALGVPGRVATRRRHRARRRGCPRRDTGWRGTSRRARRSGRRRRLRRRTPRSAVKHVLLSLPLLLLPVVPGVAQAAPKAAAADGAKAGDELFVKGEYEAALTAYRAAYKAKADPELFVRMGRCFQEMGQPELAINALERYLELAPDGARRESVLGLIAQLKEAAAAPVQPVKKGPQGEPGSFSDDDTLNVPGLDGDDGGLDLSLDGAAPAGDADAQPDAAGASSSSNTEDGATTPRADAAAPAPKEAPDKPIVAVPLGLVRPTTTEAAAPDNSLFMWVAVGAAAVVVVAGGSVAAAAIALQPPPAPSGALGTFDLR
jgi:hypothetical protein